MISYPHNATIAKILFMFLIACGAGLFYQQTQALDAEDFDYLEFCNIQQVLRQAECNTLFEIGIINVPYEARFQGNYIDSNHETYLDFFKRNKVHIENNRVIKIKQDTPGVTPYENKLDCTKRVSFAEFSELQELWLSNFKAGCDIKNIDLTNNKKLKLLHIESSKRYGASYFGGELKNLDIFNLENLETLSIRGNFNGDITNFHLSKLKKLKSVNINGDRIYGDLSNWKINLDNYESFVFTAGVYYTENQNPEYVAYKKVINSDEVRVIMIEGVFKNADHLINKRSFFTKIMEFLSDLFYRLTNLSK